MAITAQDVKKLREMTGAGMMDAKKALTEADGDFDKAIELLRKKGQKISEKRADREATEGGIFIAINDGATKGVAIKLGCETDFVARNEDFQTLGTKIAHAALAAGAQSLEDVQTVAIDGKPLPETLSAAIAAIGEKLEVNDFAVLEAEQVVEYLHIGGRVGVLVGFANVNGTDLSAVGKDVAMQVAAMNPLALDEDGISPEKIAKEKEIAIELMKQDPKNANKPDEILEKIVGGKIQKFFKENTLLHQEFVKDSSKSIAQYIKEAGKDLKVTGFARLHLGA